MRLAIYFVAVLLLSACAVGSPIQAYENLTPDPSREHSTYIGGSVLKVQRSSDLPNAFGRADIFGGRVERGFTELRFLGLAPDGRIVFRVTELDTQSTETTMSRYGGSTSMLNAQLRISAIVDAQISLIVDAVSA